MKIKWGKLIFSVAVPLVVGGVSAWLTRAGQQEFETITQPPLTPPSWVFGVVWTILYILMGIAYYRVGQSMASVGEKKRFQYLYTAQLFFNFFWSLIFFNLQTYVFAFFWLLALWALILWMLFTVQEIDRPAFWCLVPYFIWVTFAAYLNLGVAILN